MWNFILRNSLVLTWFAMALFGQTGTPVPALAMLDQRMEALLQKYSISGGALAVSQSGKLIYARGFGFADRELMIPVQPDSLFRVGSISKPITVVTALRLVQAGKLDLDARVLPLLGPQVLRGATVADPRWYDIKVRYLMQHSGGWDASATFDPLLSYVAIEALGLKLPLRKPLTPDDVIRFMATQPLQFDPGTQYNYSNFGMMLLSRILERVTGAPYDALVKEAILEPLGIQRMALGGGTPAEHRLGEVNYYDPELLPAVYPGIGEQVPAPDGSFYFPIINGAGAWIASPVDLLRFVDGVDGRRGEPLLNKKTFELMTARPSYAASADQFYGLGWVVTPSGNGVDLAHDGALNGNYAILKRFERNGVAVAAAFNALPGTQGFYDELNQGVIALIQPLPPQGTLTDQFEAFFPALKPRISGVVDTASERPKISAGTPVTIYGLNLATDGRCSVKVTFDGAAAPLLASSRNRLDVLAPAVLASRTQTQIQVTVGGLASNVVDMPVANASPGLFTASRNGRGLLAALNDDGLPNGEMHPVESGDGVMLWASGNGEYQTPFRDGEIARKFVPLRVTPRVTVNGAPAMVHYSGSVPGVLAGISKIAFTVPSSAPKGRVFVEVSSSLQTSRPGVWIWVR